VQSVIVRLPEKPARTVNNRNIPEINLVHIMAVALVDRMLTFEAAHSYERMNDAAVLQLKKHITLVGDPRLDTAELKSQGIVQGIVEVTTKGGTQLREHVVAVRGMVENPMTRAEVEKKCSGLLKPVLGEDRTRRLIHEIWNLEGVKNVRQLRSLLSAS
jgi:2-methylcitrate dehydratase PrpD